MFVWNDPYRAMLDSENLANKSVSRVQEQGARSRERILDAAEALMAERGYAGTSISAICKESGLPASSVYWHFSNKEGLLEAVLERGSNRMLDEMAEAHAAPGTPRERLHNLLQRAAAVFEAQPQEFRRLDLLITLERSGSDDDWRKAIDQFHARLRAMIEEALFEVYREMDEQVAREIAAEGARFAQTLGSGATLEAIRNPDEFDPSQMIEHFELALLALGERRLAQHAARSGR